MKVNMPFYKNPDNTHCLQACIKMVLKYYFPKKDFSFEELDKLTGKVEEKYTWTCQGVVAFSNLGLIVKHYTNCDYNKLVKKGIKFIYEIYKSVAETIIKTTDIKSVVKFTKVMIEKKLWEKKKLSFKEIEKYFSEGRAIIILINNNVITNRKGFQGHFVVVTSINDKFIWYHDSGPNNPIANKRTDKEKFIKAWNSIGTDNDVIIVSKNQ